VFPLQCLGYDVDVSRFLRLDLIGRADQCNPRSSTRSTILTTQVSLHTIPIINAYFISSIGYRRAGGTKTTAAELNLLFDTLEQNELLAPTRLLTGYIPEATSLIAIQQFVEKLKQRRQKLIYLLDRA